MSSTELPTLPLAGDGQHPVIARLTQDVGLAEGTRRGGLWLAGSSWGAQAFQFIVAIVMAHLLLPSQFGKTALVYAIAGFAAIFTDLGLQAAVVHSKRVDDELLSTAFWLNAVSGVILTLLVSAAAFPIAALYGQMSLAGLFIVVSLNFALDLGTVHLALLERTFHFRRVALIEAPATIVGYATMPLFVWAGCGIYSIVLGPLIITILSTFLLWINVPWRPRWSFDRAAVRQLWRFSRGLVGLNALNYWSRNLDNVMLGAYVSDTELGVYSRSYNLMMIPISQVSTVVMRGLYPALARLQDDLPRMGKIWVRAISTAGGAFTLPLTLTMTAAAPAIVHVLFGSRWAGMIPLLELLCLAAVPQMIGASCGAAYQAADKTGVGFRVGLVNSATTVTAIVVGVHWGAEGVAVALLIKSYVNVWVAVFPLTRILRLRPREVFGPLATSWLPSLLIFAAELAVRFGWRHRPPWQVLLVQCAVAIALFAAIMALSRATVAREMRAMLRTALSH